MCSLYWLSDVIAGFRESNAVERHSCWSRSQSFSQVVRSVRCVAGQSPETSARGIVQSVDTWRLPLSIAARSKCQLLVSLAAPIRVTVKVLNIDERMADSVGAVLCLARRLFGRDANILPFTHTEVYNCFPQPMSSVFTSPRNWPSRR